MAFKAYAFIFTFFIIFTVLNNVKTSDNKPRYKRNSFLKNEKYLSAIKSPSGASKQTSAAYDVIYRLFPQVADRTEIIIDFNMPKNSYRIAKSPKNKLIVTASSGIAATRGFYDTIKEPLTVEVAWEGIHLNNEKDAIEEFFENLKNSTQTMVAESEFIYYQNVCTWSYSFPWWTMDDWIRHIDWMALHGINLVLAPFQENIWIEVYQELGLNETDIQEHFTGPAFFAWNRMGNLRGWGGPISFPDSYIETNSNLQKQVIRKLQNLGISVALPSFAGHVPTAFKTLYPQTTFTHTKWLNFDDKYSGSLYIEPTESLFKEIGIKFLKKVISFYGTSHIYFADPFNEMTPASNDTKYIASVSKAIYDVMKTVDRNAIWLLQSWMFFNEQEFWNKPRAKAFLTAIPKGRMLVLDLHAEKYPQYNLTESFFGQPFIWCMLHNFGGNLGMHGNARGMASDLGNLQRSGRSEYSLVGVGITPEGINQNHVLYEMILDFAWFQASSGRAMDYFKSISRRRFGSKAEDISGVWYELAQTVYGYTGKEWIGGSSPALIVDKPSLKHKVLSWYSIKSIENIAKTISNAYHTATSQLYYYDTIDIFRQYLQNLAEYHYIEILDGYNKSSVEKVKYHSNIFLGIFLDMDKILAKNKNVLFGNWLKGASQYGEQVVYGACNQVTLWGPKGEIANYAMKQWAGLMKDYVHARWNFFLKKLIHAMEHELDFDEEEVVKGIFEQIERPFCKDPNLASKYPSEADNSDIIPTMQSIYFKYGYKMYHNEELFYSN